MLRRARTARVSAGARMRPSPSPQPSAQPKQRRCGPSIPGAPPAGLDSADRSPGDLCRRSGASRSASPAQGRHRRSVLSEYPRSASPLHRSPCDAAGHHVETHQGQFPRSRSASPQVNSRRFAPGASAVQPAHSPSRAHMRSPARPAAQSPPATISRQRSASPMRAAAADSPVRADMRSRTASPTLRHRQRPAHSRSATRLSERSGQQDLWAQRIEAAGRRDESDPIVDVLAPELAGRRSQGLQMSASPVRGVGVVGFAEEDSARQPQGLWDALGSPRERSPGTGAPRSSDQARCEFAADDDMRTRHDMANRAAAVESDTSAEPRSTAPASSGGTAAAGGGRLGGFLGALRRKYNLDESGQPEVRLLRCARLSKLLRVHIDEGEDSGGSGDRREASCRLHDDARAHAGACSNPESGCAEPDVVTCDAAARGDA